ncbi:hypothetical protein LCGC14_0671530 [marine sediment metagenome]|uniref:Uncharacterized protein n=1 Tax=marine sediment metagenome TaxID=412755 RepID=A0A0F9QVT5_9ZZZZ
MTKDQARLAAEEIYHHLCDHEMVFDERDKEEQKYLINHWAEIIHGYSRSE